MSKKNSHAKPGAANPPAVHATARRRFPWKWPALLVIGAGLGFGATLLFDRDGKPWGRAPEGMVWIPRGTFRMGTDDPHPFFSDARPVHEVYVDGLWMDETEVTNSQFAKFVEATGYVTVAEQKPTREQIVANLPPGREPKAEDLVPGSLVFMGSGGPVPLNQESLWWDWV